MAIITKSKIAQAKSSNHVKELIYNYVQSIGIKIDLSLTYLENAENMKFIFPELDELLEVAENKWFELDCSDRATINSSNNIINSALSTKIKVTDPVMQIIINENVSLLTAWRIYRGFSQDDVAKKIHIKLSSIQKWEQDSRLITVKGLENLAQLFKCSVEQLKL